MSRPPRRALSSSTCQAALSFTERHIHRELTGMKQHTAHRSVLKRGRQQLPWVSAPSQGPDGAFHGAVADHRDHEHHLIPGGLPVTMSKDKQFKPSIVRFLGPGILPYSALDSRYHKTSVHLVTSQRSSINSTKLTPDLRFCAGHRESEALIWFESKVNQHQANSDLHKISPELQKLLHQGLDSQGSFQCLEEGSYSHWASQDCSCFHHRPRSDFGI